MLHICHVHIQTDCLPHCFFLLKAEQNSFQQLLLLLLNCQFIPWILWILCSYILGFSCCVCLVHIFVRYIYIYVHNFCIFLVGWTFYHNKMSLFSVKKCLCHRLSACGGRGSISGLLILLHLSVHPRLNSTSLKPFLLLLLFLYLEQVSAWEILSSYIRPFLLLWASAYISRNNVSFANLM